MAADDDDNFFSRWSRRKVQVRSGQPLPVEPPAPVAPVPTVARPAAPPLAPAQPEKAQARADVPAVQPAPEAPVLTLDDVARLTRDADFKPFVGRQVPAEVRNAAMKKLFTDPHYNVMDGLDIYIDDYSQPSPLSAAMMAKMVGAQFLKLVDDPNEAKPAAVLTVATNEATPTPEAPQADLAAAATPAHGEAADDTPPDTSTSAVTALAQPQNHHDHADLQLQPDHAPERESPGRGAG